MKVLPISLSRQFFSGIKRSNDDVKIYNKNKPPKSEPGFTYSADIPIKIWARKTSELQEGQLFDYEKHDVFNRHTTTFFRPDLAWSEFGDYLIEKFSNADKVNTYVWGCSYGDEAYSLNLLLMNNFKDCEKFYPIIAKDISLKVLAEAQSQKKEGVSVNLWDTGLMMDFLKLKKSQTEKFFKAGEEIDGYKILDDKVTEPIEFSSGNIVTDIDLMDSDNPSIVFCRNMWPYVNPKRYYECAKKMYDTLKEGSILVVGSFDYRGDYSHANSDKFPSALIRAGFKNANISNCLIFEK